MMGIDVLRVEYGNCDWDWENGEGDAFRGIFGVLMK